MPAWPIGPRCASAHPQRGGRARRRRALLAGVDGVLVPGGFGDRGIEGKVGAIGLARQHGIPFFGICLGMQCAVAEYARNILGAGTGQLDRVRQGQPPPGDLPARRAADGDRQGGDDAARGAAGQVGRRQQGGRVLRHGDDFRAASPPLRVQQRLRQQFEAGGMRIVGTSPDGALVEIVEIPEHPWFVGVQFHPEFKSQPTRPHPLFAGFIGAAVAHRVAQKEPALVDRPFSMAEEAKEARKEDLRRRGLEEPGRGGKGGLRKQEQAAPQPAAAAADERTARRPACRCLANSLYLQAAISLGLLPNPFSGKAEANLAQAKHTDRHAGNPPGKDQGNRTPEETDDIEEMLHQLRLAYLAVQEHGGKQA